MRLARADLFPVLTIMAGVAIGFSLSAGVLMPNLLLRSGFDDVPAPDPVVAPSATIEPDYDREEAPRIVAAAEYQRRMERDRERLSVDVEKALVRAADLAREQFDVELGMNRLPSLRAGNLSVVGRRLLDRKNVMHDEIDDLWREIQRLTSVARTDQREVSDLLDDAATTIDDGSLTDRIRFSRGLIGIQDREYLREFEAETTRIVEEVQRELQSASRALRVRQMESVIF